MMVSCHRHPESIVKEINTVATDSIETTDHINWDDSFTVVYRQPVNGYQVKVIVKPEESDVLIMKANISFEKSGKAFTLHTSCFGIHYSVKVDLTMTLRIQNYLRSLDKKTLMPTIMSIEKKIG